MRNKVETENTFVLGGWGSSSTVLLYPFQLVEISHTSRCFVVLRVWNGNNMSYTQFFTTEAQRVHGVET